MKLSTGKIAFPIEFDNGDKQTIYFNPNDPDLIIRLKGLQDKMSERIKDIEDVELENDGAPTQFSKIEAYEKLQNALKEELDYAFGGAVSDIVFKHCSPFAIINGEYFVVQFIEAITPEIIKHIKAANADAEKRIGKHLDKYSK